MERGASLITWPAMLRRPVNHAPRFTRALTLHASRFTLHAYDRRHMILRRFLTLVALIFWQGGFTFYAAVVVPVGQRVLGSHLEQGFITREVTWYMNIAGAVALAVLAGELFFARQPQLLVKWRWAFWMGMAGGILALILEHPRLDAFIDIDGHALTERANFRVLHRIYLWTSTLEWLLGWIYIWLMLKSWKWEDGRK